MPRARTLRKNKKRAGNDDDETKGETRLALESKQEAQQLFLPDAVTTSRVSKRIGMKAIEERNSRSRRK